MKFNELNREQMTQLLRISEVGAEEARQSLSKMLQKDIRLSIPQIHSVLLNDVPELVGGAQKQVASVHIPVTGSFEGHVLLIFSEESFKKLAGLLLRTDPKKVRFEDALTQSALAEVGNILVSSFVTALSQWSKKPLLPGLPKTQMNKVKAIMELMTAESHPPDEHLLFLAVEMVCEQEKFSGNFFFIPHPATLANLWEMH